ncbi:uncharacterized protein M421DRAFT_314156 [Didymella exigua CBS 183.55]|uniref:Uncharacterized protein n=1 Tax=Didymella exigua CBS 183.55 TaxID=1150837 RepID=A0A6A5S1X0_9PLEO|nr:uncharacterized protein M421DRAFT_314156 [Didymella exigua CBS 183.55]KAF1931527.1 hypothetical protein M421DRAFT_314156 [Didymella exigua CBS 183.55]
MLRWLTGWRAARRSNFFALPRSLCVHLNAHSVTCKTNITIVFLALPFTARSRRTLVAALRFQHARKGHCTTVYILLPATAGAHALSHHRQHQIHLSKRVIRWRTTHTARSTWHGG